MNLRIRNITLGELNNYLESDEYKNHPFVPISRLRAVSHINNPRADKSDYCLFLAYDDQNLIAYLGAVPDILFSEEAETKVYWISCMWVHPGYRRHRLSVKLMTHAYQELKGNIVITGYHKLSKYTFDKTGHYSELTVLKGKRWYIRSDLKNILIRKRPKLKNASFLFGWIDNSVNFLFDIRLLRKINYSYTYEELSEFDENTHVFLNQMNGKSLFKRNTPEFKWMIDFPWVVQKNEYSAESRRYFFSQEGKDYKQWFIRVTNNERIVGFLILTRYRRELKMPYSFIEKGFEPDVAKFLAQLIIREKIPTFICYNEEINTIFNSLKLSLYSKQTECGFLISKELKLSVNLKNTLISAGDGDGVFT